MAIPKPAGYPCLDAGADAGAMGLVDHAEGVGKKLWHIFFAKDYETFVYRTTRNESDATELQAAFEAADRGEDLSQEKMHQLAMSFSMGDKMPEAIPERALTSLGNPKEQARVVKDDAPPITQLYDRLIEKMTALYDDAGRFQAYQAAMNRSGVAPIGRDVMLSVLGKGKDANNRFLVSGSHSALQIACLAQAMSHSVFADVPTGSVVFFVVGESQVGKSTMLNALVGKVKYSVCKNEETEEDELCACSGTEIAERGDGFASCTHMINIYADDVGRFFADCPGFGDSRGFDIEAGMVSGVYLALRRADVTVKVLRVWDAEKIKMPGPNTTRMVELANRAVAGNPKGGTYCQHVVAKRGKPTLKAAAENIKAVSAGIPATEMSIKLLQECAEKGLGAFPTLDMLNGLKKSFDTDGYPDTCVCSMDTIDNLVIQMTRRDVVTAIATPVVRMVNSEMKHFMEATGLGFSATLAETPAKFEKALNRLGVIIKSLNLMVQKTRTMCSREDGNLRAMEDLNCHALLIPLMAAQKVAQIIIASYFARFVAPMLNMLKALDTDKGEMAALDGKLSDLNRTLAEHMRTTSPFKTRMEDLNPEADDFADNMYRIGIDPLNGGDVLAHDRVRAMQEFKEMFDKIDATLCDYTTYRREQRTRTEGSGKRQHTVCENVTVTEHNSRSNERAKAKERVKNMCRSVSLHLSTLVVEICATMVNASERYNNARNMLS